MVDRCPHTYEEHTIIDPELPLVELAAFSTSLAPASCCGGSFLDLLLQFHCGSSKLFFYPQTEQKIQPHVKALLSFEVVIIGRLKRWKDKHIQKHLMEREFLMHGIETSFFDSLSPPPKKLF